MSETQLSAQRRPARSSRRRSGGGSSGAMVRVRQIRSGIGFEVNQKLTLKALGLGRIGRERTHPDNAAIRGMIETVRHLVEVVGPSERMERRR